jgi:hypothetical protein
VRSTLGLSERSAARNYVPGPTMAKGLPSQLTLHTGALDRWIHTTNSSICCSNPTTSVHKAAHTSTIPAPRVALVDPSSCANLDSKSSPPFLATHSIVHQHPSTHPNSVILLTLGFLVPEKHGEAILGQGADRPYWILDPAAHSYQSRSVGVVPAVIGVDRADRCGGTPMLRWPRVWRKRHCLMRPVIWPAF